MKLNKIFRTRAVQMFGDCKYCGHSVIYHVFLVGCTKCGCNEFH